MTMSMIAEHTLKFAIARLRRFKALPDVETKAIPDDPHSMTQSPLSTLPTGF
jgi:hypothetical protein